MSAEPGKVSDILLNLVIVWSKKSCVIGLQFQMYDVTSVIIFEAELLQLGILGGWDIEMAWYLLDGHWEASWATTVYTIVVCLIRWLAMHYKKYGSAVQHYLKGHFLWQDLRSHNHFELAMSGGVYILSNEPNVHSCYVTTKNEYKFVHTRYIIEDTTRAAWGHFFKNRG